MRLTRVVTALAVALAATAGQAQLPEAFEVQTYEPAPSGDLMFASQDATVLDRGLVGSLVLAWAAGPLVLRQDGQEIPGGQLVHRQTWGWAAVSYPLAGKVLVDLAIPVALHQTGSQPYPDLAPVAGSGFGDLRLGARLPVLVRPGYTLALAARIWLPTGSVDAYASDGAFRYEPDLIVSGEHGPVAWSGSLGYHTRPWKDVGYTTIGSAVTVNAGAAWRIGEFRVGPELFGQIGTEGSASPFDLLAGGHWRRGAWDAGLAIGTGLNRAAGAAPARVIGQLTWCPKEDGQEAAARAAAQARAEAERLADEREAALQAEADKAAADRAAADKAAADKMAADQAAAERAAAEKAAADRAAAERLAAAQAAAAASTAGLVKLTDQKIEILQSIQFESGKDVISASSEPTLQAVATILRAHPELTSVRVEGHTDAQGPKELNLRLSGLRAQAVKRWLVETGGIDAGRLSAEGFGQAQPVADNATAAGRAKNRRVDFRIAQ